MRGKRLFLILVMAGILAMGWGLSIQAVSGTKDLETQTELVRQAEILAEKKLYVRAIPLYEKALTYQTESNAEIESKLLNVYKEYGDTASYLQLVEKRVRQGSAQEEEYLTAADYYMNSYNLDEALILLKEGISQLGSYELENLYEANRYSYTVRVTDYQEIIPTKSNNLMPAYNGESWCYINKGGKAELPGPYDTAVPFNSRGYGVVSKGGSYYTIVTSGARYGVDETGVTDVYAVTDNYILAKVNGSYSYYNYDFQCMGTGHQYEDITKNSCGVAAVKKDGKWGIITDTGELVVDFMLEDVAVNSLGCVFENDVAMVKLDGMWYLVNAQGQKLSEQAFFNAKAPESSGYIAVADANGKWGFINQSAELVIECQYQDACSFSNHLGAVKKADTWGYVSEKNELVIDELLDNARPFHNGIAQAHSSLGAVLIKLENFEE